MNIDVSEKWSKWLGVMSTYVKRNVRLYRMKYVYETSLRHPRTHPDQPGLCKLDYLCTYIYEYDGGVIGHGGHYEVVEDTTEDDMKLPEHDNIRVGVFTRRNGCRPTFYLISSCEEDTRFYSRCEEMLYDAIECRLYYSIRYNISSNTYYVLSGIVEWTDDIFHEIVAPPCPSTVDVVDRLRHTREYLEGVDLDAIYKDTQLHTIQEVGDKYSLDLFTVKTIGSRQI